MKEKYVKRECRLSFVLLLTNVFFSLNRNHVFNNTHLHLLFTAELIVFAFSPHKSNDGKEETHSRRKQDYCYLFLRKFLFTVKTLGPWNEPSKSRNNKISITRYINDDLFSFLRHTNQLPATGRCTHVTSTQFNYFADDAEKSAFISIYLHFINNRRKIPQVVDWNRHRHHCSVPSRRVVINAIFSTIRLRLRLVDSRLQFYLRILIIYNLSGSRYNLIAPCVGRIAGFIQAPGLLDCWKRGNKNEINKSFS